MRDRIKYPYLKNSGKNLLEALKISRTNAELCMNLFGEKNELTRSRVNELIKTLVKFDLVKKVNNKWSRKERNITKFISISDK